MRRNRVKTLQGFTLLELSLAMLIVGLLLGRLLLPLSAHWQQQHRAQTREKLEEGLDALYGFVLHHHRLPCPDCADAVEGQCATIGAAVNDGMEDVIASGDCAHDAGLLPRATLGITGRDAWGRIFTYRVTGHFADSVTSGAGCTPDSLHVSFGLCSEGNIDVIAAAGTSEYIARWIPALIVSHGSNGANTSSAHETENLDGDAIFVDRDLSGDASSAFDDVVGWISPQVLRAKMVEAGILP